MLLTKKSRLFLSRDTKLKRLKFNNNKYVYQQINKGDFFQDQKVIFKV